MRLPNETDSLLKNKNANEACRNNAKHRMVRRSLYFGITLILISVFLTTILCISHSKNNGSNDKTKIKKKESTSEEKAKKKAKIAENHLMNHLNSLKTLVDPGCQGVVMIIRNCERWKEGDDDVSNECSFVELERAEFLSSQFGNGTFDRWPIPSFLYASADIANIDILDKLSKKISVDIIQDFDSTSSGKLAKKILNDFRKGRMCNNLSLISWRYSEIADLSQKLGCSPYNGCKMSYDRVEFDEVWQIHYIYKPSRGTSEIGPNWEVFGTSLGQGFDPLHYRKAHPEL